MAKDRDVLDMVTMEDLQDQHREIAECVGIEGFRALVRHFGGDSIYIPQEKEAAKLHTYRMIREEFDGTNVKALARKYGVSRSTVYNVIREQLQSGSHRHPTIPGQMSLMDLWKETEE